MAEHFKIGTHSLDPQTQYVHSCSGETIDSCKLERMKTPNGQCTKRCRWLKVTKTKKKTWKKQKKQRVLAGTPSPSKESRNIVYDCFFVCFSRFLPSVGYFKETGMNHRQSCQSAFESAVKHLKISS